jgi:murein DD-endopeptidase MepM/ murein hydrolase activator NlpD
MNRSITFMVSTSGKRGFRQVTLSPVMLLLAVGSFLLLFVAAVWGSAHLYRIYADGKDLRSEYATLQREHATITGNYRKLEQQLKQIESLEANIRKVIGLPEDSESLVGSASAGIGGSGQALDWHGLILESPSGYEETAKVTKANERSEAIPLASTEAVKRAEKVLGGLTEIEQATASEQRDMAQTPTITPIKEGEPHWITSNFGVRVGPFTGRYEFHSGLDISAAAGTPVVAAADGTVITLWNESEGGGLGNAIKIQHGSEFVTVYGHLQRGNPFAKGLRVGSKVRRNQVIGYVGGTGRVTSPHLHYEIHYEGVRVNPQRFLLDR